MIKTANNTRAVPWIENCSFNSKKNVTFRIITLLLTQYLRNCKKSNLIKFIETVCKQNSESADPVNIYTNDD